MQAKLQVATSGTVSGLTHAQTVNDALAALASRQGGASSPSDASTALASMAGLEWHDTGSGTDWLRDQADGTFYATGCFDETNKRYLAVASPLYGLTLSASSTTLTIAHGACLADTADNMIVLAAGMSKTLAGFSPGSGQGALDAGTVADTTWYHVYAIKNPVGGVTDILLSTSATTPSLPANYTRKALLGAVYVTSSGSITPFTQTGNEFLFTTGFQDVGSAITSTVAALQTLTVPPGISVRARFRGVLFNGLTGNTLELLFQSPDESSETPNSNFGTGQANMSLGAVAAQGGNNGIAAGEFSILTNTAGQISVTTNIAGTVSTGLYAIYTTGFIYPRGLV